MFSPKMCFGIIAQIISDIAFIARFLYHLNYDIDAKQQQTNTVLMERYLFTGI